MKINELIREDLKNLVPYEPHPYSDVIKLDANENSHPFPEEVINEIKSRLTGEVFSRYPDPTGEGLKARIAEFTGVKADNIILGNGSDELIQLTLQTFGGPGRRVIIPVPTFSMYKIHGQITGTLPVEIPRNPDFGLDSETLLEEMNHPDTRLVFIASPNNPTGNAASLDQIETILQNTNCLVVVDEAYINFGGESCVPLLKKYSNLIILKTFSKIGLAGLRIGYLLAHNDIVRELLKVKQPYNVNAFSQIAAEAVIDFWPLFHRQIQEIILERDRVSRELGNIKGVIVFPSAANFILFRVPQNAGQVHQSLLEQGVLIRKNLGTNYGLTECLRVTIGTEQENEVFMQKIKKILTPKSETE